jgi:hypothetical protein
MEASAHLERSTRAFRGPSGVDDAVDSDLASAQTPSFSSHRPGQHRFERGDFLGWSLSFAAKRFSAVFDAAPCFGRAFYIENSILLTQMPVIVDEEFFQLPHEFLAQVPDMLYVGVAVILFLDADDPIVALLVFFSYPARPRSRQSPGISQELRGKPARPLGPERLWGRRPPLSSRE